MEVILSETSLKKHGQDISKLIPALVKDVTNILSDILHSITEIECLKIVKTTFEQELN